MTISSFFSLAVVGRVRKIGRIFKRHGYIVDTDMEDLWAREFGQAVAGAFCHLTAQLVFPPPWPKLEASTGRKSESEKAGKNAIPPILTNIYLNLCYKMILARNLHYFVGIKHLSLILANLHVRDFAPIGMLEYWKNGQKFLFN